MPAVRPGRGLAVPVSGGTLQVPVGVVDRPYLQRRDPLAIDLANAAGHLAVVGGPRAGKSGAVRTVVLALALTHRPDELGVHVIDFGGGGLSVLAGLPHVGTVTDRQHPDVVRRVVAEAAAVLDRRERLFRAAGVGSVEEFRARRAAGEFPAEAATDVLLVVDGYLVLRGEFDDLEARLLPLAAQGLSYGLHLVVTASRWSELRPALKDVLGSRLELRLGEPAESEVDRRRAAAVPARPGHGLAADGAPMVLAAPWLSTPGTDAAGDRGHRRSRGRRRRRVDRPVVRPGRDAARAGAPRRRPRCRRGRCRTRRGRHSDRSRRGGPRPGRGRSGRGPAPGVLRGRGERQDHPAAGGRARAGRAVRAGRAAHRGRRLPPRAARRRPRRAPARLREFGRRGRGGGPRHRGVPAGTAAGPDRRAA